MTDVPVVDLRDEMPVINRDDICSGIVAATPDLLRQLDVWGFMALQMPGIRSETDSLLSSFFDACTSTKPRLSSYSHDLVPQISEWGNHGFFPMYSEVPRLAKGVADPKEYVHISGAMLSDDPQGSAAVLRAFPELAEHAYRLFDTAFQVATGVSRVLGTLLLGGSRDLGLASRPSILRVIHYLDTDGRAVLAHEHSGIQMLGVQLPPSDQGLQYVLNDGQWVEPLLAGTDVVLCNIGRMLTLASAQRFRPSTHRVHRSQPGPAYERLSAVLFAYPEHEARQWTVDDSGVVVGEATWGDFMRERFRGITHGSVDGARH